MAPVGKTGAGLAQIANPGFQDAHRASESRNPRTSRANRAEKAGHDAENREVWRIGLAGLCVDDRLASHSHLELLPLLQPFLNPE